jgi:hypothetical protein
MLKRIYFYFIGLSALIIAAAWAGEAARQTEWSCPIFPAEYKVVVDTVTKNPVRFITTAKGSDRAFYFTHNCVLPDGSLLVFSSDRSGQGEYWGYVTATGELAQLLPKGSVNAGLAVVSRRGNKMFVARGRALYEWQIDVQCVGKTQVKIRERKIGDVPAELSLREALTENSNGTFLSLSASGPDGKWVIAAMNIQTGAVKTMMENKEGFSHVEFSHNRPDLIMYAGDGYYQRLWLVDFSGKGPWKLHKQLPGELVTHECWWVGDLVTFCGGYEKDGNKVESHLKIVNIKTQETRIIGAGAYWPQGTAAEVAELNWWHACGDPTGHWVAGDNWHGGIAIFDAQTTQKRLLTTGHRKYGRGTHPEVGWDTQGQYVIFGSEYFGNPDVCIAEIPKEWSGQ